MIPFLSDQIARQHIQALRCDAQRARLAASDARRPGRGVRRAVGLRLVSAGLTLIDGREIVRAAAGTEPIARAYGRR
jgi:hypothetical protein